MPKIQFTNRIGKPVLILTIQLFSLISIFILITCAIINNNIAFSKFTDEQAKQHLQDVSYQLTQDIKANLESSKSNLKIIADSILVEESGNIDNKALNDFLERKAQVSEFYKLEFVSLSQASKLPYYVLHQAHTGMNTTTSGISYDLNQNLVYNFHTNYGILIGTRNSYTIKQLIQPRSFNSKGMSYIVDSNGNIIISPDCSEEDNLIKSITSTQNIFRGNVSLFDLKTTFQQESNYVSIITTEGNEPIILSYHTLGINNWGVLTLLPKESITLGFQKHANVNMLTSIFAMAAFLLIMTLAYISFAKNKQIMEKIGFTDRLTGGLNNAGFQLQYQGIVTKNKNETFTVLFMNIKDFKFINLQFGMKEGDKTLRYIYNTIKNSLNKEEFVARTDADNFFICLKDFDQEQILARTKLLTDSITEGINSYIEKDEKKSPYNLLLYIGACQVKDSTEKVSIVQEHARQAYDKALQTNAETCIFYQDSFTKNLLKEQELNNLFQDSINNKYFKLYMQPKIRLQDGKVGGTEVLVRWQHPKKGMIFPNEFIPLFEKNGKICKLDMYMFRETCKIIAKWRDEGRRLFPISVNLSRQHYSRNPQFLDEIRAIAEEYNIPKNILEIELTESIFFETDKFKVVKESIERMHELGFLCSLDDFGVGFSSLSLLKEFDIDTIKFDRQFFLDISTTKSKDLINGLIELLSRLGINSVAEGIETEEQVSYLSKTQCHMIQGYFYSKPLPIDEIETWIEKAEEQPFC